MIEINLLPGARKAKRSKGAGLDFGAALSGVAAQVKDPFLIIAVIGLAIGLVGVGAQYVMLNGRRTDIEQALLQARTDSARYHAVRQQIDLAEAQRDSVVRQFSIISTIDSERFTWPHILDELSQSLPQYTWIVRIQQTSQTPSVIVRDSLKTKGAQRVQQLANAAKAAVAPVQLRVIGQTVDVQAITRYWRVLEASPFIEKVNLIGTQVVQVEGREVVQFQLDMQFQKPDSSAIRTVPLNVLVR